jgi:hypothetical protein
MRFATYYRQVAVFRRQINFQVFAWFGILLAGLWNLSGPGVWWDEGWTLSVARNWVERGFYGRLLDGQPAPPGLEAAFPVTAPVALMFRLFGVGVWQGRLFGVLCMLGALAALYYLASRLYNRSVGIAALVVLLFMSMNANLHPLIISRQVLAEPPMLCYLLAGYVCLLLAFRGSSWWLALAAICWGVALATKLQVLPFWLCSLLVPLMLHLIRRQWYGVKLVAVGLLGSIVTYYLCQWSQQLLLDGHTLPVVPISGLYNVLAIVPNGFNRLYTLFNLVCFGLPTLLALVYAARQIGHTRALSSEESGIPSIRIALLGLSGSWLAWYVLLSVGILRYLFPATFIGSIFVAAWLSDLTSGFDIARTVRHAGALLSKGGARPAVSALLVLMLLAATTTMTLQMLDREYLTADDHSAQAVTDYLNTQTPPSARVETYESELHFLLNRPYHYPPDQIHVELNRRSLLNQQVVIDYDPLAGDPDYLVVGGFTNWNKLYSQVLATGAFRLVQRFGVYELYRRVR